ncbi:MAG: dockerin type I domain-containing protein [Phycisphaerales bacterium]|jgi:hypothetical protein|nr:dockerin type I domain-containing protein [Phycisphaerales bacterium]
MSNHALIASLLLASSIPAFAGDGGAILKIANVNATRGQTVAVPVAAETMDIIGAFGFNAMPVGLSVDEVLYNGPIFSNGWEGWDTAPSDNVRVDAACIFTEDQVAPGDHPLVGLVIEIPDFLEPGTVIPILLANVQFFNYDFSIPTLEAIDGSITVFRTADLNGNGSVESADIGLMIAAWGAVKKSSNADLNGDQVVDGLDLGRLLDRWATEG